MSNYYVTIAFYSEPNYNGNMTMYFLHGIKGNKISYGGTTNKKLYCQKNSAIKSAKRVKNAFPTAKVEVAEIYSGNGIFGTQVIRWLT